MSRCSPTASAVGSKTLRQARLLPVYLAWALSGCAMQPDHPQAELYPENQQPHFKTCAARVGGTYHERALQKHQIIDIYQEPAPDEGLMTDECVVRE